MSASIIVMVNISMVYKLPFELFILVTLKTRNRIYFRVHNSSNDHSKETLYCIEFQVTLTVTKTKLFDYISSLLQK